MWLIKVDLALFESTIVVIIVADAVLLVVVLINAFVVVELWF